MGPQPSSWKKEMPQQIISPLLPDPVLVSHGTKRRSNGQNKPASIEGTTFGGFKLFGGSKEETSQTELFAQNKMIMLVMINVACDGIQSPLCARFRSSVPRPAGLPGGSDFGFDGSDGWAVFPGKTKNARPCEAKRRGSLKGDECHHETRGQALLFLFFGGFLPVGDFWGVRCQALFVAFLFVFVSGFLPVGDALGVAFNKSLGQNVRMCLFRLCRRNKQGRQVAVVFSRVSRSP